MNNVNVCTILIIQKLLNSGTNTLKGEIKLLDLKKENQNVLMIFL